MDNLESLFNKKEYQLVADLTEKSEDPEERLLRLTSLVMLNKTSEALDEIESHQAMFDKAYPKKVMKLHFELLLQSKLYAEAKLALKHYEDLPYISQEVEEFLRDMKQKIEDEEHHKDKSLSVEEVCERLEKESNSDLLLEAVSYLRVYNLSSLIDSIRILLTRSNVKTEYRAIALFVLMEQEYSKEVDYLLEGKIIKIVPAKLCTPFEEKDFLHVVKEIESLSGHNVTVNETAVHLFSMYVINTFPSNIYQFGVERLAKAFIHFAKLYLHEESSESDENIIAFIDKIKPIIEK